MENLPTVAVALLLLAAVVFVVKRLIRNNRKGKSSCSCSCNSCVFGDSCKKNRK